MKCESCSVQIGAEFAYAIQNNQCPACGDSIMQQARLASYLSLRTLLANNFEDIDAEKISTLIVANFELRQMFKEELQKPSEGGNIEVEEDEDDEPDEVVLEDGVKLEKPNKKKTQAALQKMRDEVFNEAIADQYGTDFTDSELLLTEGGADYELKNRAKQERSRKAIASGAGGIRRSE